MPFTPLRFLLLLAALIFLVAFVQLGVLTVTFEKLGLSQDSAYLLLITTLAGSMINLPLFSIKAERPEVEVMPRNFREFLGMRRLPFTGKTVIAVNVGGCITPLAFSIYLLQHNALAPLNLLLAVAAVAAVAYSSSRLVPGIGITTPFLVAPLVAAIGSAMLSPEHRAPLAYISGTIGVLIGADLLRLKDLGKLGVPVASIGGAGSFDGIFLTGLLAVLLT
jgi:uncharacterized membrane protein